MARAKAKFAAVRFSSALILTFASSNLALPAISFAITVSNLDFVPDDASPNGTRHEA
jgi:hypothetical protein